MPPLGRLIRIVFATLVSQLILLPGAAGTAAQAPNVSAADASVWNRMFAETSPAPTFTSSSTGRLALGQSTLWYRPKTLFGATPVLQAFDPKSGEVKRSYEISPDETIAAAVNDTCILRNELGELRAYTVRDFEPIWTHDGPNIEVILGAEGEAMYGVAIGNIGGEIKQIVIAIDVNSGQEIWRSALANDPFHSSPGTIRGFVAGGVVAVWITDEGIVSVLNTETGAVLWGADQSGLVPNAEPVATGQVFVIERDRTVHAREALTGRTAWTFPMASVRYASAVLNIFDAGDVIVGAYATPTSMLEMDNGMFFRFVAIDAASGSLRWEYPADSNWLQGEARFAADDQTVYAGVKTGRADARILALDMATGDLRWTSSQHVPYQPVTVSDGHLILATQDGWPEVLVLDAVNGSRVWQKGLPSTGAREIGDLFVSSGLVYAYADGMSVLRLSDGSQEWSAGPIAMYETKPLVGDRIEGVVSAIAVVLTIVVVAVLFFAVRWLIRFGRQPVPPGVPPSH